MEVSIFDIQINDRKNHVPLVSYVNYDLWVERKWLENFKLDLRALLSKSYRSENLKFGQPNRLLKHPYPKIES